MPTPGPDLVDADQDPFAKHGPKATIGAGFAVAGLYLGAMYQAGKERTRRNATWEARRRSAQRSIIYQNKQVAAMKDALRSVKIEGWGPD